ncbi:ATP-binding protein [Spirochaetia bacterium 38H-sp]|uniref:histidine kinase n=1 Tax=Rarispira pelagica TaxID=3141764 RepID=A0ABU9UCR3_9SPIR
MHYSLSDFILELVQNSLEAGANDLHLIIKEEGHFFMQLSDNGKGMTEEEKNRALDPFFTDGIKHPNRRVGLGLAFLSQMVSQVQGDFSVISGKNKGTCVSFSVPLDNVDTPPVGDISSAIRQAFSYDYDYELFIERTCPSGYSYTLSRREIASVLGDFSIVENALLLDSFIREQEASCNT